MSNQQGTTTHTTRMQAFACAVTCICTCALPATAQTTGAKAGLEEIVVTAQRFQQNLQAVPIAVTAQSGVELERKGVTDVSNLQFSVPGLSVASSPGAGSGGAAQIFIRGVGQFDYSAAQEPDVPIYLDGVYLARPFGAVFDFLDLNRVEVLRGPQGTLFGRNTLGGAVQIITNTPNDEWMLRGKATLGSYSRRDVEMVANLPLSPTLSFRVAASSSDSDGYGKLLPSNTPVYDDHNTFLRGQLRWRPDDATDVILRAERFTHRASAGLQQIIAITQTPVLAAYNATLIAQGFQPVTAALIPGGRYDGLSGQRIPDVNDGWGVGLDATRNLGAATLKSITAYRELNANSSFDFFPVIYPLIGNNTDTRQQQFSQELQLSGKAFNDRLTWIGGLYYFHERNRQLQNVYQRLGVVRTGPGPYDFAPNTAAGTSATWNDQKTNSYAAFAQIGYEFLPRLTATLGVRVSKDSKTLGSSAGANGSLTNQRGYGTQSDSWSQVTPKYGLDYKLNDDVLLYAAVSHGFRAGGFNGRVSTATPPNSFGPEKLIDYEAGIKAEFLERRLRVNLGGFYYDYQNYQASTTVVQGSGVVAIVGNAAALREYGGELEVSFLATQALRLSGFVALLHHKFVDIVPNTASVRADSEPPNAPKFSSGLSAQYTTDITGWGEAILRGDWSYKGKSQFFLPNFAGEAQKGYSLVNARLTVAPYGGKYEVSLFGTNIFDQKYRTYTQSIASSYGATTGVYGPPARWGVSLGMRF